MIVVDATVLADRLAGTDLQRDQVEALVAIDPIWVAPVLWRFEVGNVLWKKVRFQGMTVEGAKMCLADAEYFIEEGVFDLRWNEVLSLAQVSEISFYDASYVWLAESRGLPLYSRDERLRKKCPEVVRAMPGE